MLFLMVLAVFVATGIFRGFGGSLGGFWALICRDPPKFENGFHFWNLPFFLIPTIYYNPMWMQFWLYNSLALKKWLECHKMENMALFKKIFGHIFFIYFLLPQCEFWTKSMTWWCRILKKCVRLSWNHPIEPLNLIYCFFELPMQLTLR